MSATLRTTQTALTTLSRPRATTTLRYRHRRLQAGPHYNTWPALCIVMRITRPHHQWPIDESQDNGPVEPFTAPRLLQLLSELQVVVVVVVVVV